MENKVRIERIILFSYHRIPYHWQEWDRSADKDLNEDHSQLQNLWCRIHYRQAIKNPICFESMVISSVHWTIYYVETKIWEALNS